MEVSSKNLETSPIINQNHKRLEESTSYTLNLLGNQPVTSESTVIMHPILEEPHGLQQLFIPDLYLRIYSTYPEIDLFIKYIKEYSIIYKLIKKRKD